MPIHENSYVSLTTFTKNGRRKNCPVWIANLGEENVGFTTEATSWKAKRISHTPQVELQPCNSRGILIEVSDPIFGVARLAYGDDFQNVQNAIREKYGFQFLLIVFLGKIKTFFRASDTSSCAVIITVNH